MNFFFVLASLVTVAGGLTMYDSVGSMTSADVTRQDCYKKDFEFRCDHLDRCRRFIRGLDRLCERYKEKQKAIKARKLLENDKKIKLEENRKKNRKRKEKKRKEKKEKENVVNDPERWQSEEKEEKEVREEDLLLEEVEGKEEVEGEEEVEETKEVDLTEWEREHGRGDPEPTTTSEPEDTDVADRAQLDPYPVKDGEDPNPYPGLTNPYFITELQNITITEGDTLILDCVASGKPPPRVAISTVALYRPLKYFSRNQGTTEDQGYRDITSQFKVFKVTEQHTGWYRCAAANPNEYITSDAYVTVQPNPCLRTQCGRYEVCVNEAGVARCKCPTSEDCDGYPPKAICGSDCNTYLDECQLKVAACMTNRNITIMYNHGCPRIRSPAVNQLTDKMVVQAGSSLRLTCGASGVPAPEVAWYRVTNRRREMISTNDILEIPHVQTNFKGNYQCVATNCAGMPDPPSIRSRTVNVEVLDIQSSDRRVCHVFGDPHVTTFDGTLYSFVGNCDYVLAMDCAHRPDWFVYGRVKSCGSESSCLQSITVIKGRTIIQFTQGWTINTNGSIEIIANGGEKKLGEVTVAFDNDGLIYTITLDGTGVAVTWDGYSSATVIADSPLDSCGLCGSYDRNSNNDIEKAWFAGYYNNVQVKAGTFSELVGSWKLDPYRRQCPKTVAEEGAPYTDTCSTETEHDIVEEECSRVLAGDSFSHCIQSDEQLEFYTRACIRDSCGKDSRWAFCEFVESVKQHCQQETEMEVVLKDLSEDRCPTKQKRKVELIRHLL